MKLWEIILKFLENYGMDSTTLIVVGVCFWKLFTNHLSHIDNKIDVLSKQVSTNNETNDKKLTKLTTIITTVRKSVASMRAVCKERGDWIKSQRDK